LLFSATLVIRKYTVLFLNGTLTILTSFLWFSRGSSRQMLRQVTYFPIHHSLIFLSFNGTFWVIDNEEIKQIMDTNTLGGTHRITSIQKNLKTFRTSSVFRLLSTGLNKHYHSSACHMLSYTCTSVCPPLLLSSNNRCSFMKFCMKILQPETPHNHHYF